MNPVRCCIVVLLLTGVFSRPYSCFFFLKTPPPPDISPLPPHHPLPIPHQPVPGEAVAPPPTPPRRGQGDHGGPRRQPGNAGPQPVDPAAELVPERDRGAAGELIAKDVDIGPADPRRGDHDPDLAGARLRLRDVAQFNVARSRLSLHDGLHGPSPSPRAADAGASSRDTANRDADRAYSST